MSKFKFSSTSKKRRDTCHKDLIVLLDEMLKYMDITVVSAYRDKEAQTDCFMRHTSKKRWPFSKHNKMPSMAVDIALYPINWKDKAAFIYLAGHVMMLAKILKENHLMTHDLKWSGDWDSDNDLSDQALYDLGHFELI